MKIISGEELLEDTTHAMAAVQLDVEASPIDPEAVVEALTKLGAERGNFGATRRRTWTWGGASRGSNSWRRKKRRSMR